MAELEPQIEGSNIIAAMLAHKEMQARFADPSLQGDLDGMAIGSSGEKSWYVGIRLGRRLTTEQMASLSEGVGAQVKFYGPDRTVLYPPPTTIPGEPLILPA